MTRRLYDRAFHSGALWGQRHPVANRRIWLVACPAVAVAAVAQAAVRWKGTRSILGMVIGCAIGLVMLADYTIAYRLRDGRPVLGSANFLIGGAAAIVILVSFGTNRSAVWRGLQAGAGGYVAVIFLGMLPYLWRPRASGRPVA